MSKGRYKMPSVAISKAKDQLTSLRRDAQKGIEIVLEDTRRKDDQTVSLILTSLLDELCSQTLTFTYQWVDEPDSKNTNYSLWNNETGVYGVGTTKQEAIDDYIKNIIEYAGVYYGDLGFYLSPSGKTKPHYWYLRTVLRFMDDRQALLSAINLDNITK